MKRALLAVALLCSCALAIAQTPNVWPGPLDKGDYSRLDLITLAQPAVRHRCRVHSVTKDTVVCGVGLNHKAVTYTLDDIAALIIPPSHSDRNSFIAFLAFSGACVAASFFVPAAAAILLRVAAGLPTAIFLYLAFSTDRITEDGSDHSNDILIYQRPGTPLTVTLSS